MALQTLRSDLHPPTHVKTYTLPVSGATSLHTTTDALLNVLPSAILLNITTGGTYIFKDGTATATSNTITFAAGTYVLPFTCSSIEIGTAIGTATVAWHPEP
jgi:hypothetical protein